MAITGIFTRSRPSIGGIFFDATLEESDELQTDVTRYPVETGFEGNDHAVNRNARITMFVALSDNPVRSATALATQGDALERLNNLNLPAGIIRAGVGIGVGRAISALPPGVAAAVGLGASVATNTVGQALSRSASVLEQIRALQSSREIISVVTQKASYQNVLITNTRRTTNPRNEGGLELVVEMEQLNILYSSLRSQTIVAPDDPNAAMASPMRDRGRVSLEQVP